MAKEFTLKGIIKFLDDGASETIKKVDENVTKLSKGAAGVNKGFKDVASGMALVGAGGIVVGAGIGKAVKTSMMFEQQMARVGALADSSNQDLQIMTITAKKLGATTEFSALQAGQGLEALALAGFSARDSVQVLPTILDAATAGAIGLGQASDIVVGSMGALATAFDKKYSTQVERATHLSDVLALAGARTNTGIVELGESITYGGAALAGFGIPLTEIIAAMGQLSNANLKGSQAGTALTNMMTQLTSPSEDVRQAMNLLGVDMTKVPLDNMANLVQTLSKALGKLKDPTQRQTIAMELFGQRGIRAFAALENGGVDSLRNLTKELDSSAGFAEKSATRQRATFLGQVKNFESAVEGILIEVGDFFTKNEKQVLPAFASLVGFLSSLGQAFQFVSMSAHDQNKAIQAMGGEIDPLISFAQGFKAGIEDAFDTIKSVLMGIRDAFGSIIPEGDAGLKMIGKFISKGAVLLAVVAPLLIGFAGMVFVLGTLANSFFGFFSIISGGFTILQSLGGLLVVKAKLFSFLSMTLKAVTGGWKFFVSAISIGGTVLSKVFSILKIGIMGLGKALVFLFTNPVGLTILGIAALIAAGWLLYKNWDTVTGFLGDMWGGFVAKITDMWTRLVQFFANSNLGDIILSTLLFPLRAALTPLAEILKLVASTSLGKSLLGGKVDLLASIADKFSLMGNQPLLGQQQVESPAQLAARQVMGQGEEAKRLNAPMQYQPDVNVNIPEPVINLTTENTTVVDGQVIERTQIKRTINRTERAGMNASNPKNRQLAKLGPMAAGFSR